MTTPNYGALGQQAYSEIMERVKRMSWPGDRCALMSYHEELWREADKLHARIRDLQERLVVAEGDPLKDS